MADAQVKLNPLKILVVTNEDSEWRSLTPGKISPACEWLVQLELEPDEDPEEVLSMHEVNRRLSQGTRKNNEWLDLMLKELTLFAEDGRPPQLLSPVSGRPLRKSTMIA